MSRDPIEEEGGLNLYTFVAGDPNNLWDPFGLKFELECKPGLEYLETLWKDLYKQAKGQATGDLKKKLEEMEKDEKACKIKLRENDKNIFVGNFQGEALDMGDLDRLPRDGECTTKLGAFVHEAVEQWERQVNKVTNFDKAHATACEAESKFLGNKRLPDSPTEVRGNGNTTMKLNYEKNGQKYQLRLYFKNGDLGAFEQNPPKEPKT